jgi:hypothetical protein
LLFGLTPATRLLPLWKRRELAGKEYGLTEHDYRGAAWDALDHEQDIIRYIGGFILGGTTLGVDSTRQRIFEELPYTPRPALEKEFVDALQGNSKVIYLVGDAGVGKSRLAYELTARHAVDPVLNGWVRCGDPSLVQGDIEEIVYRNGMVPCFAARAVMVSI